MLYVAKLHAYAVLHACECKDKARQSKNKRFQFLWQYVAGVCRLQRQKQQEKLARLQRMHEQWWVEKYVEVLTTISVCK